MDPLKYEIVFVDDYSTDDTYSVIKCFEKKINIQYIRHEQHLGRPSARNTGFRNARGTILAFYDSDIVHKSPDLLSSIVKFFKEHLEACVVMTKIVNYSPQSDMNSFVYYLENKSRKETFNKSQIHSTAFGAGHFSLKRETFERLTGFNETLGQVYGEDMEFGFRIGKNKFPIYFLEHVYSHHLADYLTLKRTVSRKRVMGEKLMPILKKTAPEFYEYRLKNSLEEPINLKVDSPRRIVKKIALGIVTMPILKSILAFFNKVAYKKIPYLFIQTTRLILAQAYLEGAKKRSKR